MEEKKNNGKKTWRVLFLILAVALALWLAGTQAALWLLQNGSVSLGEAASVGIIGGADGPTAIFVTRTGTDWDTVLVIACMVASFAAYLRLGKRK